MFTSRSLDSIRLIAKENPKAVVAVCLCLLLSSLLEAVGVSAIFPLISIIMDMDSVLPSSRLTDFIDRLSELGPYLLSLFIILSFVMKAVMLHFATVIVAKYVAGFSHKLRVSFIDAILGARIHYLFSESLGGNLSVLTTDSVRAAAAYTSATRMFAGMIQATIYLLYALWLSVEATLLSILTIGVLLFLIKGTMRRSRAAGAQTTRYVWDISKTMGEALRGMKEAKATGREGYLSAYIVNGSDMLRKAHATSLVVAQMLRNIQDPVTVTSALACLLIFKEVLHLEPGHILFILAVYYRMMGAVNVLVADYQKFVANEASLWAIKDGIRKAEAEKENLRPGGIVPAQQAQEIIFSNVSMVYGDKKIFSDFSFSIPAKTFCIFKGESGRGKTTCIDIICGLVEPTAGRVLIGKTPLPDIDTRAWRAHIGYVDQFPFLFKGTIRENILFGLEGVSETQIQECLKLCHLEKVVDTLAGGLEFELNEGGTNLSGGQRQRVAIARSVIRDPSYLILDEPTSALDQESAEVLFQTLKELSKKMSVIAISHSPAAQNYADSVINFDRL